MSMPPEWRASFPVVDLSFQLRIRVDSELLLEQETFYQDQRRISLVAFGAFADGIVSQEQRFDSGPIHDGIDLLHFFIDRLRSREENSELLAKEKLVSIFLKLIAPPRLRSKISTPRLTEL